MSLSTLHIPSDTYIKRFLTPVVILLMSLFACIAVATLAFIVLTPYDTKSLTLISAHPLPDIEGGVAGEGFTGTGLSLLSDGTWVIGNDGRTSMQDQTYESSVVLLSSDMTRLVANYPASRYVNEAQSVQGVVALPDDTIWFTVKQQQKLVHITREGKWLNTMSLPFRPNGLTYDHAKKALIAGTDEGYIHWLDPHTGSIVDQDKLFEKIDQLHYAGGKNPLLYITSGQNGKDGFVTVYDLKSRTYQANHTLSWLAAWHSSFRGNAVKGSRAIEGVYVDANTNSLIIVNDEHFHGNVSGGNSIIKYDLREIQR
jgi:hypothetical protein